MTSFPVPLGIGLGLCLALLGPALLAGCGSPPADPAQTPESSARPADRDQLAGLAAAAKDKRYVATYTLSAAKRSDRTVTAAFGADGTWLVAVPAGALGGLADVAVYASAAGLFQCALGPAAGTAGSRPDLPPASAGCVKVAALSATTDPRVEHIFTDWIDALTNRATALSVAAAPLLNGANGACYSVESNSAALAPPVDPGIYCYRSDGILTAARVGFGTLTLAGRVGAAPPSVTMPGPVVDRAPLPLTAPAAPAAALPVRIGSDRGVTFAGPVGVCWRHYVAAAPPSPPRRGQPGRHLVAVS